MGIEQLTYEDLAGRLNISGEAARSSAAEVGRRQRAQPRAQGVRLLARVLEPREDPQGGAVPPFGMPCFGGRLEGGFKGGNRGGGRAARPVLEAGRPLPLELDSRLATQGEWSRGRVANRGGPASASRRVARSSATASSRSRAGGACRGGRASA